MTTRSIRQRLQLHRYRQALGLLLANIGRVARGEAYCCSALSGKSDYNICINADMSVSCNCADIDGSGHIGDLALNTLEEIFGGATAKRFRARLARGILPIRRCAVCRELVQTSRAAARAGLSDFAPPTRGIMVENTVLCNLKCVNCQRRAIVQTRKKLKLSLADMEKVAREIRRNGIRVISFFNLGEPFMSDTIGEELAVLKRHNPQTPLYVSTNGLLLHQQQKREAALLVDYLFVSLDGATNESVNKYQVGGNFDRTYGNMAELVALRNARNLVQPVIEWKYVVFSWNDGESEITRAVELARAAKVDILSFWAGDGTPEQVSTRFKSDAFFQRLGEASWKGREIDFRK